MPNQIEVVTYSARAFSVLTGALFSTRTNYATAFLPAGAVFLTYTPKENSTDHTDAEALFASAGVESSEFFVRI